VALDPFEPSSRRLRCFFITLSYISAVSPPSSPRIEQPRRDLSAFTPEHIEFLGPNQQLAARSLSYHRHGYRTTSRLAKDPPSAHRSRTCQLARRGLLFNLKQAGLYLPGQDPRKSQTSNVPRLERSLPAWELERKCRGCSPCIECAGSDTRDAFVEARPGRKKISRNLLHAQIPSLPGLILSRRRVPIFAFAASIDFEP